MQKKKNHWTELKNVWDFQLLIAKNINKTPFFVIPELTIAIKLYYVVLYDTP